jgi:hypothetical protein
MRLLGRDLPHNRRDVDIAGDYHRPSKPNLPVARNASLLSLAEYSDKTPDERPLAYPGSRNR